MRLRPVAVVAEDDPAVRKLLARVLDELGFYVIAVSDGLQALYAARWRHPELVITDDRMPDMTGSELVRELRADARFDRTRVIVFSGGAGDGTGADRIVPKTEGLGALVRAIRETTGGGR
ncbi:MAG: response regulator [Zetaproteobacteria bacterium]|nr:MAG: response regulator [Zetaproteobacteria bacterium]